MHRDNNLNLLRLVAALMVLYAHSFVFYGKFISDFIGINSYGGLGVEIFFIISGYLIVKSWDADPNWSRFMLKRSLRIFPALIVVVVLSVLVLGPIFTRLELVAYFTHPQLMDYFKNIALYPVYYLPGVLETARLPNAVNGSLWSLPVEFFMYLVVLVLGVFARSSKWVYLTAAIAFAAISILWCWGNPNVVVFYGTDIKNIFSVGVFFLAGAVFGKFKLERFITLSRVVAILLGLLMLAPCKDLTRVLMMLVFPFVVIAYGVASSSLGSLFNRLGDCSYGVYIYAFPVQQFLLQVFPSISYSLYLFLSVVISMALGFLSWHLVEKRFLDFKPKRAVERPGPLGAGMTPS